MRKQLLDGEEELFPGLVNSVVKLVDGDPLAVPVYVDRSGTIALADTSQNVMDANPDRAGWLFQNLSQAPMRISEIGGDAAGAGAFVVQPFGVFPPPGMPVTLSAITVSCEVEGEAYTAREW